MSINKTDIVASFGNIYLNTGEGRNNLYELMNFRSDTEKLGVPVFTQSDVYRCSLTLVDEILQPFQKQWTPKGTYTFKPTEIVLRPFKADQELYPDDIKSSWLGFLAGMPQIDRKMWPIVRYIVEVMSIPQIAEDYERKVIYNGVYAAPTPGTPGTAASSMNGIGKIIADHITSGRTVPIVTGALSTNSVTFVEQIEQFSQNISDRYYGQQMFLAMSPGNAKRYAHGYQKLYGTAVNFMEENRFRVPLANLDIVGLPSMIGSNRIWSTVQKNFIRAYKEAPDTVPMAIENIDRQVKMYTDFSRGVGFAVPEALFVNDQI